MRKVPAAMSSMVSASTRLRPIRSESGPKNIPPRGRTRKATANSPATRMLPSTPSVSGKKTVFMVRER